MSEKERSAFENEVGWDGERMDPDGAGPLAAHGSVATFPYNNEQINSNNDFGTGDGFTTFEEYRGFVGACNGTDKYAHRRLSACRKEILVEVDVMAPLPIPQGAVVKLNNTGVNPDALLVPEGTWEGKDLEGLWVEPNTNTAANNGQRLLIGTQYTNGIGVYQTNNGNLKNCTPVGAELEIHPYVAPTIADLTDLKDDYGIMALVDDTFMRSAGVKVYYIIDQIGASASEHRKAGELSSSDERFQYAYNNRQRFDAAGQEDYRRFLHLMFVDVIWNGDAYSLRGQAGLAGTSVAANGFDVLAAKSGEWGTARGSNDHFVMVSVSPTRNKGNAMQTYLGAADAAEAQRRALAFIAAHELGHALRIDSGGVEQGHHNNGTPATCFNIQSNLAGDWLFMTADDITHPCWFQTRTNVIPPPIVIHYSWLLWQANHDTVAEIHNLLPVADYAKSAIADGMGDWPALDLNESGAAIQPISSPPLTGGPTTAVHIYDCCWINSFKGSWARVIKNGLGWSQTENASTPGTPRISVRQSYAAPKYKY